jgi:transcriptional regulator with XRE-family HTH domain
MGGVVRALGIVCRELREEEGSSRTVIAGRVGKRGRSEGPVAKFENGRSQPRDLDAMIEAYADALNHEALAIWEMGLDRVRAAGSPEAFEQEIEAVARQTQREAARSERAARAKGSRRAARGSGGRSRS